MQVAVVDGPLQRLGRSAVISPGAEQPLRRQTSGLNAQTNGCDIMAGERRLWSEGNSYLKLGGVFVELGAELQHRLGIGGDA